MAIQQQEVEERTFTASEASEGNQTLLKPATPATPSRLETKDIYEYI